MKKRMKPMMRNIYAAILLTLSVMLVMMLYSNWKVKRLAYDCLNDKAGLYMELQEKEIQKLSKELLVMRIFEPELLMEIPYSVTPQETEYYGLWQKIKNYNVSKATVYNNKYDFYEYTYDSDLLILDKQLYFSTSIRPAYLKALRQEVRSGIDKGTRGIVWDFFETEGMDYLYGCVQKNGRAVGCIVSLDQMLSDIEITNLGYEGFMIFERDGEIYADTEANSRKEVQELLPKLLAEEHRETSNYAWSTYQAPKVGNIKILILLNHGVLNRIVNIQMLSVAAFILLICVMLLLLWNLYNRVLKPMKKFVDQLKNSQEDQLWLNETMENSIPEIEYASERFRKMFREIQTLRIDIYEKELAEKKIILEYAQEQIRPHFFLNCMSIVQSMAELHHEDDIVHMLDVLSDYMKYVIQDTFEPRLIRDEIEHIQNYMELQKLCKPGAFEFEVIMETGDDCRILPLVLQTFVENTVAHGLIPGTFVEITVYITSMETEDGEFLYIVISDTGIGFSKEALSRIEQDQPIEYNGCEHIGIWNTKKRVKMFYGEKAEIKIGNMEREGHGAVVELTLPKIREKNCCLERRVEM